MKEWKSVEAGLVFIHSMALVSIWAWLISQPWFLSHGSQSVKEGGKVTDRFVFRLQRHTTNSFSFVSEGRQS